jgi:hypothetical protein
VLRGSKVFAISVNPRSSAARSILLVPLIGIRWRIRADWSDVVAMDEKDQNDQDYHQRQRKKREVPAGFGSFSGDG